MNHVEPLSQRHPARMSLTPGQHSLIATAYDRGAFDVSLPNCTKAVFAKKSRLVSSACMHWRKASGTERESSETERARSHGQPVWVHRHLMVARQLTPDLPTRWLGPQRKRRLP
jgi:hypothetical protein